jgi:hypothetical protein
MLTRRQLLAAATALPALPLRGEDRRDIIRRRAEALAFCPGEQLQKTDLAKADKIADGFVFFNNRTPIKVGLRNIDWTGGHVHHQEWPAQLNRFFHLSPLAAAYAGTKNERYAAAARAYIEDWMQNDPYPNTPKRRPGDSALSMSIRLGSSESPGWTGNLHAFLSSPAFDDPFLDRMLSSLSGQADFAASHLAVGGNWYISQLDALVLISLRLPFLKNAATLRGSGLTRLRHELSSQFLDDGVHIERTPSYHHWMTNVTVSYIELARRFPEADAQVNPQRLVRSLDYCVQSEFAGFNDSGLPGDGVSETQLTARRKSLEVIGLTGKLPPSPPLDQVFPNAGHVFSRTGWDREADYLAFDAGTWGSTHSHLSRLSFTFRSRGRVVVADPGILSYEMRDPFGPYGKSTPSHSTVSVDGWNQSSADAQLLHTEFTPETVTIRARYQGGWWKGSYGWGFTEGHGEGIWGEHERILYWVKHEYLVIIDSVTADAGHTIHNGFQMAPAKWSLDRSALRWTSSADQLQLVLAPKGTTIECLEGQSQPPRGWVGFNGKDPVPAPHIQFRYPSDPKGPVVTVVVIATPAFQMKAADATAVAITKPNGRIDEVTWSRDQLPRRRELDRMQ